ncbi:hypothetical protein [Cellulosimicrobium sp. CUA-896]|uniref:hypothetical protein n=1 Tax=Cellulosimicrobium sp. CUA-896 TaxID=1517881 RepID=UPI00111536B0|nr:hypothetical protein [Cellulosimicrobium sp. CUA-896]
MADEHGLLGAPSVDEPRGGAVPLPGPPRPRTTLDDALGRLDGLEAMPTATHVEVLEAVHAALVADLASTED